MPLAEPLGLDQFGIPAKARYYLSEIARYICRDMADDPEAQRRSVRAALRVLERECERGALRGVRIGRCIVVPSDELTRYFLARTTVCSPN